MTKPQTFKQVLKKIQDEALDKFSGSNGGIDHFKTYDYEVHQLHERAFKCREVPPIQTGSTLASAVSESGKLNTHEKLLTSEKKMHALHNARSLLGHAIESGHEGFIGTAKSLLSGIYTELSPVRDNEFGHTMMLQDLKVIEGVNASLSMIKGMSHIGREASKRQNQTDQKSPKR